MIVTLHTPRLPVNVASDGASPLLTNPQQHGTLQVVRCGIVGVYIKISVRAGKSPRLTDPCVCINSATLPMGV